MKTKICKECGASFSKGRLESVMCFDKRDFCYKHRFMDEEMGLSDVCMGCRKVIRHGGMYCIKYPFCNSECEEKYWSDII